MNKPLSEIATIYNGTDYKHNPPGDTVPIYGTGGLMGYTSVPLNHGPAVLSGRKGSINNPIYLEGAFWNVDTIFCIKTNEGVDTKWLFYNFLHTDLTKLNEATGVPSITSKALYKLKFEWFEYPEQCKIAQILSTTDAVIEKTRASIAKYKAVKQGMLHDFFSRGIDSGNGRIRSDFRAAPELYKASPLGEIPQDWNVERLGSFSDMKSGEGITSRSIHLMGKFRVFGGNGLRGYTSTFTHDGEFALVGRQGALCGNVFRVSGKFYASEHAVVVTASDQIHIDWLYQKLKYMNLNQYSEASAQPGLSVSKILKLKAPKPPFAEQEIIAACLSSIDAKLDAERNYLAKLLAIKAGLMTDLLSGKKPVKVKEGSILQKDI